MTEICTWIVFHAHPTQFIKEKGKEEDFHPDFFGVFVCPELRTEPEQLLGEVLGNRNLTLVYRADTQLKSKSVDWGMHERLKAQMDEQGYGMSLIKLHQVVVDAD